jgi:hypothetical protein
MTEEQMRIHGIPELDKMGYSNAEIFKEVSMSQLEGARALAKHHSYQWDVVAEDPRVSGRRFLEDAKIVLYPSLSTRTEASA